MVKFNKSQKKDIEYIIGCLEDVMTEISMLEDDAKIKAYDGGDGEEFDAETYRAARDVVNYLCDLIEEG